MFFSLVFQASTSKRLWGIIMEKITGPRNLMLYSALDSSFVNILSVCISFIIGSQILYRLNKKNNLGVFSYNFVQTDTYFLIWLLTKFQIQILHTFLLLSQGLHYCFLIFLRSYDSLRSNQKHVVSRNQRRLLRSQFCVIWLHCNHFQFLKNAVFLCALFTIKTASAVYHRIPLSSPQ